MGIPTTAKLGPAIKLPHSDKSIIQMLIYHHISFISVTIATAYSSQLNVHIYIYIYIHICMCVKYGQNYKTNIV
jgi:hypothetical protein